MNLEYFKKNVEEQLNLSNSKLILNEEQGGTNITYNLFCNNQHFILQSRKEDVMFTLDYVNSLYTTAGFFDSGLKLEIRSYAQKAELHNKCQHLGMKIPKLIFCNDDYIITQFINGIPYNRYNVELDSNRVISILSTLFKAHKNDIILGDRWAGNTLVTLFDIYFIDFDFIYLSKDNKHEILSRSFELAAFIYDFLLYAVNKNNILYYLCNFFNNEAVKKIYDTEAVSKFLKGYSKFYTGENKPISITSMSLDCHYNTAFIINELTNYIGGNYET